MCRHRIGHPAIALCLLSSGLLASGLALAQQASPPVPTGPTPAQPAAPAASTMPATPAVSAATPPVATPTAPTPATNPAQAPAADTVPRPDPVEAQFRALDSDGDGRISANEHAAGAKSDFDGLDRDRNYHVSGAELSDAQRGTGAQAAPLADQIRGVDSNGNGELSADEHRLGAEAAFRGSDRNGDGNLDMDEMKGAMGAPAGEAQSTP